MGPYKNLGSTPQASLWAHTGLLAAVTNISQWAHVSFDRLYDLFAHGF
jgi:hypothetical protein